MVSRGVRSALDQTSVSDRKVLRIPGPQILGTDPKKQRASGRLAPATVPAGRGKSRKPSSLTPLLPLWDGKTADCTVRGWVGGYPRSGDGVQKLIGVPKLANGVEKRGWERRGEASGDWGSQSVWGYVVRSTAANNGALAGACPCWSRNWSAL
ncbi:hypothetical protein GWK47_043839 [Chionoecetes opilio]|uniref:Uncharacterized protein n=1 Tax=Chionoecetes opilio TaxID=41210 RepID=A0A8J5CZF7_CHIOP|nr:hypothetical protein GWK47_043839 [Chionoecetes opilio]